MLVGSALGGLGAYAFQVIGTRSLGDEAYAPIGVLWTIQYLSMTVALVSVEAYLTRTITLHPDEPSTLRRALAALSGWVLAVALLVGTATLFWRESLFHGAGADLPVIAALTVLGYGLLVLIRGQLAGQGRFGTYGVVTGAESLVRVAAALPVALLITSTRSLAWTLPVGTFVVAAWWLVRGRHEPWEPTGPAETAEPIPLSVGSTSGYLAATTVANASSQVILASGPLVLVPLGAGPAEISVFFITITAARVPLVFAFGGVLSRILPSLTRAARAGELPRLRRLAVSIYLVAAALALVGAAAGAWIGPDLVALMFGEAFTPPGWFVGLTVAGVTVATAGLGLNQILIAMEDEKRMVLPWLAGLTAAILAVLVLAGTPTFRVAVAFVIGEAVALTGLLVTLLTARRGRH